MRSLFYRIRIFPFPFHLSYSSVELISKPSEYTAPISRLYMCVYKSLYDYRVFIILGLLIRIFELICLSFFLNSSFSFERQTKIQFNRGLHSSIPRPQKKADELSSWGSQRAEVFSLFFFFLFSFLQNVLSDNFFSFIISEIHSLFTPCILVETNAQWATYPIFRVPDGIDYYYYNYLPILRTGYKMVVIKNIEDIESLLLSK